MAVLGFTIYGAPDVYVSIMENPWFIADSAANIKLSMTAASNVSPEAAIQVLASSDKGYSAQPLERFKVAVFGVMNMKPGTAAGYGGNFVVDMQPGVGADVTGIAFEANLNVRNAHYGDVAVSNLTPPYAAPIYIATGGDKRATAAIMVNCGNAAAGNMPFNRGIVFWGGTIRLNTIEDHCAVGGSMWFATGAKNYGIHWGNCTFAGSVIAAPNFNLDGGGNLTFRMMHNGVSKAVVVDAAGVLRVQ